MCQTIFTKVNDVDCLNVDSLVSCRHSREAARVGSSHRCPPDNPVAIGKEIFRVESQVGECSDHHLKELLGPSFRRRQTGSNLMFNEVIGQQIAGPFDITIADQ